MAAIDYPSVLGEAWAQSQAPRKADAPTVISTFAGGGGSSLGYLMAGYKELLAVEWDDNAVATLRLNFPELDIYHGDIASLSVEEVLKRTGLQSGEPDVLDGSPPCQGFSTAGNRQMDDPRNNLFREYVRLLRGLRPKVFVMENVSGMVKGKMKLVFAEILQELKASGYQVSARLLNAMYFHVPQSRERMIFIGVRDDLTVKPTHPRAQTRPFTVREAIADIALSPAEAEEVRLTPLYEQYWHQTQPGCSIGKLRQNRRLHFDKPSITLQTADGNGGVYHPSECRSLCEREMMRLGAFPDDYRFVGGKRHSTVRIGNSVPPLFMRAIAKHIRYEILNQLSNDSTLEKEDG